MDELETFLAGGRVNDPLNKHEISYETSKEVYRPSRARFVVEVRDPLASEWSFDEAHESLDSAKDRADCLVNLMNAQSRVIDTEART